MAWCLVQGAAALAVVATIYVAAMHTEMPADSVRTMAFLALVGANITLIFVNRTFASSLREAFGRPNRVLWWGLGIVAMLLMLILVLPGVRLFFGLGAWAWNSCADLPGRERRVAGCARTCQAPVAPAA